MTPTSRIAVFFAVVGSAIGSAGCTLVSGWSDLQGGGADASASPGGGDSSTSAGGRDSGTDAAADSATSPPPGSDSGPQDTPDASSVVMTVACGATRCPLGQGCCAGIVGGSKCEATSQTCTIPATFVSCSDSAQCTASLGHAAQCCEETAPLPSVSCRTSCTAGSRIVCDPTFAAPGCPAGQTCQPSVDGYGYDTCQ